jgi:hypothetical protein
MLLMSCGKLLRSWASLHTAGSAIKADPAAGSAFIDDVIRVDVMNNRRVHVRNPSVVVVLAAPPVTPVKSGTGVAEPIVNTAVETNRWPPITGIPGVEAVDETPVTGGPEEADCGRENPNAGYPVVAIITICPITRLPDVAGIWTKRLGVDG